jgi:hypothetical protein
MSDAIAAKAAVVAAAKKKAELEGKPRPAAGPNKTGRELVTALVVVALIALTLVTSIWFGR